MHYTRAIALFIIGALVVPTHAFWILSHHHLVTQRLDPIINGNNVSAHAHAFVGSAAILGNEQNTTCTTAEVKADRSRYWAPQLYFYSAVNQTFDPMPMINVNTYYLNRGGPSMGKTPKLTAFPQNFRMIAGNSMSWNAPINDSTATMAVSFVCLGYKNGGSQTSTFPNRTCPDGIRTQIVFPSCWNGVDLDSPNHQSHVAYPINGHPDTGDCSSTHPVKFMTLFYEFIYSVGELQNGEEGAFVLSNGDTTGYSFHADFISGWDVNVLQDAIEQCTDNLFGDLQKCPPFQPTYQREQRSTGSYCTASPVVQENALSLGAAALPGCNPIRNGAFQGQGACQSTVGTPPPTVASAPPVAVPARPTPTKSPKKKHHHKSKHKHKGKGNGKAVGKMEKAKKKHARSSRLRNRDHVFVA